MAVARAWTPDEDAAPRAAAVRRPSLWREVIVPCLWVSLVGLLAVSYLLLSARVSALEIQREDAQKRIETAMARRTALWREYQRVTGAEAVQGYATSLGLQSKPEAVQTVTVTATVPHSRSVASKFEQQPVDPTAPLAPGKSPGHALAQVSP